jgi:DNA processing protein
MSRLRFSAPPRSLDPDELPTGLADLPAPPERLFVVGSMPEARAVAIVGTRAADPEQLAFTRRLAAELAGAGIVVVSGGALGIDAAAHRGALDVDGITVAVLASSLVHAYPPEHVALFEQIAERGALLCEHEDVPAQRGRFLQRNRLVAAMTDATVVVQAPVQSGALSTAAIARQLGRHVLAVPSAPWDLRSAGSTALLAAGARVCRGARDVLDALELAPPEPRPTRARRSRPREVHEQAPTVVALHFEGDAAHLHAALTATPAHRDELALRTGLDVPRLQRALLELLLAGAATEHPDGRIVRLR